MGWRFNTVTTTGVICGLPTFDAYTPPAQCIAPAIVRCDPAAVPGTDHDCGHRLVTELDGLCAYESARRTDSYLWGAARTKASTERGDGDHRVVLHVAAELDTPIRGAALVDPPNTLRAGRLVTLHGWLRHRDAHLAPLIRAQYPFPVTVLDGDDFTAIHNHN
uniref:Uncharacterized protein n=1 Tax=Rhodococcus aetherivorans I24 TaxID=1036179 RepID=Q157F1_9NOCA|nr:hypothetical protein [Rhodococcus aetherivorans I24]